MPTKNLKEKKCRVCNDVFTPTNGRQIRCFECIDEYNRSYRKTWVRNNPSKSLEYQKKYKKLNLETIRKKNRDYKKKWRKENPIDSLMTMRLWRKNNVDRRNQLQRIWAKKNKEYVYFMNRQRRNASKNAPGKHTLKEWKELKKTYNYTCPSCLKIEPEITLEEDHIVPISKGGTNYIQNIQPLCGNCNRKKYTTTKIYATPNISRLPS